MATHALPVDTNLANADLIPSQGGPPYELFAKWRESDPVHWNPAPTDYECPLHDGDITQGFWVLTRYDDVSSVSRDQSIFSSHDGSPVIWDFEPHQLMVQQAGLMGMKPEQHMKAKKFVQPPFMPKNLRAFEPEVERVAKEIIDAIADEGSCEFVFDVASKLPVHTFCVLMGIPEELRERVFKLGNESADIENFSRPRDELTPTMELMMIAEELAKEKRANPDNSMFSEYIHAEVDGERMDPMSINMFFVTMAIAGHETTRATAGHFIRLMNEHPDQYELIKSDPDKYLPNAIEEVLRHSPPVIKFRRTATQDAQIGDQNIAKGDKIYLSYPAANRDPGLFEDPDRFDIQRENAKRHLSFGIGPHICLGARLAQMQLFHLLKQVVTRIPDIKPDGDFEMLRSIWFNGIIKMPVTFTPETKA
jgi:cytochrome P450